MSIPLAVEHLRVREFGCIRDVQLDLTPIHALIGPNDSGKSTLLRAAQLAVALAGWKPGDLDPMRIRGLDPRRPTSITMAYGPRRGGEFTSAIDVAFRGSHLEESFSWKGEKLGPSHRVLDRPSEVMKFTETKDGGQTYRRCAGGARLLRLEADALRTPCNPFPDDQGMPFFAERGTCLAATYDAILKAGDDSFAEIRQQVRDCFPSVKTIRVKNLSSSMVALEAELQDGTRIPTEMMSDGLLYFLAFAALQAIAPPSLVLIEEPENGLHPSRIAEVMRVLRSVSHKTQILLATHSPLVVNELAADEVTVVTRDAARGTQAHPIRQTPNFEERSRVYSLGELWLAYADGVQEQPLFNVVPP